MGGPIVQDKLGFRVSGFRQDSARSWVDDYLGVRRPQVVGSFENNNWGTDYSLKGALLWHDMPELKATLSVFHQSNYDNDGPGVRGPSPAQPIPLRTFANTGTVNGVQFSFPATVFGGYTVPAQTWFANYDWERQPAAT